MLPTQTRETLAEQFADEKTRPILLEPGNPFAWRHRMFIAEAGEAEGFTIQSAAAEGIPVEATDDLDRLLDLRTGSAIAELKRRPRDPYVLNNAGLALLNAGKIAEAEELFLQATSLAPHLLQARANLAKAYALSGDLGRSLKTYLEMTTSHPKSVIVLMNLAHLQILLKRLDEAETVLTQVVELDEANAPARGNRGFVMLAKGRFSEAIADLRAATRINVRDGSAYNNLGVAYALIGAHKKAAQAFTAALAVDPLGQDANKNLSRLCLEMGQANRAVDILSKYLSFFEGDIEARNLLGKACYLADEYDLSIKHFNRALELANAAEATEHSAMILNNLGVLSRVKGRFLETRGFFERAISTNPKELLPRQNLAELLLDYGRLEEGRSVLDECLRLSPDNANTLTVLAVYHMYKEDYLTSLRLTERAIGLEPKNIRPYGWLTILLGDILGKYPEVVGYLQSALKYHPNDRLILNNLAYSYLMMDKATAARKLLDRIDQKEAGFFVTATRGLLLLKENNVQEGRSLYNFAARTAPNEELRSHVLQKRSLELARHFLREGDTEVARRSLREGLSISSRNRHYLRQLQEMLRRLS